MTKFSLIRWSLFLIAITFIFRQTFHSSFAYSGNENSPAKKVRTVLYRPWHANTRKPFSKQTPEFFNKDSFSTDGLLVKKYIDARDWPLSMKCISVQWFSYDNKKRLTRVLQKNDGKGPNVGGRIYKYDDEAKTITQLDTCPGKWYVSNKWFLNEQKDTIMYLEYGPDKIGPYEGWKKEFIYDHGKISQVKYYVFPCCDDSVYNIDYAYKYFYSASGQTDSSYFYYLKDGGTEELTKPNDICIFTYDNIKHISVETDLKFNDRKVEYIHTHEFDANGNVLHYFMLPKNDMIVNSDNYYSWNENGLISEEYSITSLGLKSIFSVYEYTYY